MIHLCFQKKPVAKPKAAAPKAKSKFAEFRAKMKAKAKQQSEENPDSVGNISDEQKLKELVC